MLKIVDISPKPRLKKIVHRRPVQTARNQTAQKAQIDPIPFERWPFAFKVLAKLATPEDQGIGDVIDRMVGPIGGSAFKVWHKLATGHDCGCGARKQILNARYPSNSFGPF
jgi:hypothetical protein